MTSLYAFDYERAKEQEEKEIENRLEKAMEVARTFVGNQESGRLSLHIDRYGDIKLDVTINQCNRK